MGQSSYEDVLDVVLAFLNASTWTEAKQIAVKHLDQLCSKTTRMVFVDLLQQYAANQEAVNDLSRHWEIIQGCCAQGVDAAFAKYLHPKNDIPESVINAVLDFLNAETWTELKGIVEATYLLLFSDKAEIIFEDLIRQNKDNVQAVQDLIERRHLLEQCKRKGIDQAFVSANPLLDPNLDQALSEFLYSSNSWSETRNALLKWQPLLVSQEALKAIDEIILPTETDNDFAEVIQFRRDLLEKTLKNGMQFTLEQIELLELADSWPQDLHQKVFAIRTNEDAAAIVDEHPETWPFIKKMLSKNDPEWSRRIDEVEEIQGKIQNLRLPFEMPARIELCKQAIHLLEDYGKSELWALFQGELANSYAKSSLGSRRENIEKAIDHYKRALGVLNPAHNAFLWAMTQYNLGNTYHRRIDEDRFDNIELAIYHHLQALTEITSKSNPIEWADIQHGLGTCHLDRYKESKTKNVETAIGYLEAASKIYKQKSSDVDLAMVNKSLGQAYMEKADPTESRKAITYFNEALNFYTVESYPLEFAYTHNSIATAYRRSDNIDDIKQANIHLIKALKILTIENHPREYAGINHNLGLSYSHLSKENTYFYPKAVEHLQIALDVRQELDLPLDLRNSAISLGNLQFRFKEWEKAEAAYAIGIEAGEILLIDAYTIMGRRLEISDVSRIYAAATYCLLKMGRHNDALYLFEQGKARLMAQALSSEETSLSIISSDTRRAFEKVNQKIKNLEYHSPVEDPLRLSDRELSDLLKQARDEQKRVVEKIHSQQPEFIATDLTVQEILETIPEKTILVAPLVTQHGTAVFIIPSKTSSISDKHILWLDNFTTYYLTFLRERWQKAYQEKPIGESLSYINLISDITNELWDLLIGPIHDQLQSQSVNSVIFMPQGGLQMFPLHAAWHEINGKRHFFMDDYSVSYIPSVYSMKTSLLRVNKQKQKSALIAGVEKYSSLRPLKFSRHEVEVVARILKTSPLFDGDVTKASIKEVTPGKAFLHFSCHGEFAWQRDALDSAIFLYNDEPLTLAEIIGHFDLKSTRLATLSSCESGIVDLSVPDEAIGLPAGFLQAGVAGVVSTLWPIDDLSTSLLMEIFYDQMINHNESPQQALQTAQIWLRNATNGEIREKLRSSGSIWATKINIELGFTDPKYKLYKKPYYWAAFIFTGT